ncbi:hypothetical protein GGS24DRAFT_497531 [Hypoxylon argillaceum]|nr:hypothetical protein GGS24DRAFT_497531 [Hypoxylon argillaceum]KAI1153139.1 hypothetical protein F4825DRAFT_275815 [Nemania diffusa]
MDSDTTVHGLSKGVVAGLKSLFVGLALVSVILRLVANWKYNRRLLVDDYVSITAIPFLVAVAVLSEMAGNGFHDPNESPYIVAQLAVAISIFTPLALWTCKAPILFLYIRLFGIKKWLRVTSYATLTIMALVYVSGIIAIPPACTPRTKDLSEAFIDGCQGRTRMINVYLGSVSVLADVIILVLPMPVVFGLKLLVRSRVGLIFLFLSGLFAIAASIISLFFKAISLSSPATSLALSILATITECSVALIVGCVPSMRVLWSKILKPGVKTSRETYSTAPTGNRTNRGASQYIVVGEGTDRKTPDANTLIVSTEVHTSTTTVADYQQQQQQAAYRQTYHPPDGGRFDEAVPPPFGVYTEAYALQTRHQGVWGR